MSSFDKWVCVFPGKMGISWKLANDTVFDSKKTAEDVACQNCNVVAVPLELWERYREYEHRSVVAERKLVEVAGLRLDYARAVGGVAGGGGSVTFVDLKPGAT